ncbi:ATP-binding cassette domain-containing protein [Arthrobacter sp. SDTb3-6]|uniref:AAA family ATPase n=1 Tax=Arthrobacter sp. SDTb3-6 TaxID=2713571 RepID=UPI00159D617F|nr:ATP-binding cassette domain-containing protein [Arthrobacter sp. SDTb3-6]NVM97988.1 ATP-binding cassette domain-containing protein [Arthrobacter sp. SDTb3-6]
MRFAKTPVRHIGEDPHEPLPRNEWPATLAAVRQLLDAGLDLGPATVLVGENGAGKSTLVEAIAMAYGLNPEGGSTGAMHRSRATESALANSLLLARNPGAGRYGYFLRAETMHGFFSYLEDNPSTTRADAPFHRMSHGESFLSLAEDRFRGGGLWILDEPESALSFTGCLSLLAVLRELLADGGSQIILSTHSPLLAALPGADIYEVGGWGLRPATWDGLDLVRNWRSFLDAPQRFLRHL